MLVISRITCALALVTALAPPVAVAQSGPQGDTRESIAELPDWGGLWEVIFSFNSPGEPPRFTGPYAAILADYRAAQASGEIQDTPAANCVPGGMPSIMAQPYPIEFLFTPGKVTIMIEAFSQWRQIFTDGRQHPEDPNLTFNGHSIGHWEGATLVVDTVGFTADTPLERYGMRHSEEMRIVELMRLNEEGNLEIQTTVDDPVALERPWTTTREYDRHRDWTLAEYVCQENNRNFMTPDGKAVIDLEYEPDE